MRLFIAVDVPENIKEEVVSCQEFIGSKDAKISWVAKKNLHLTLKFLGEISESKLSELKKRLSSIKFDTFDLSLDKFGCFPSFESAKVLWVGVKPEEELRKLANLIDSETLGFSKNDLEFKAHLTIGRVKVVKFKKEFVSKLEKACVNKVSFKIDSFSLYRSKLTKQGAIYELVERFELD